MYMKRTIKYGNRIEVRKYHTFRCPGKGERARGERKQPTKEQMAAANERRAVKKLKMLMIENFGAGDWHLVLTYAKDNRPDATGCRKLLRKFFERCRKLYRAAGVPLKYIMVTEWEAKAIHHHIVISDIPGIHRVLQEIWKEGGIHLTPLYQNKEFDDLAEYLTKETRKTFQRSDSPMKQRWTCSRNLKRPEVHTEQVNTGSWKEEPSVPKSLEQEGYVLDKTSIVADVDAMGYPFQEYTMIRYEKERRR